VVAVALLGVEFLPAHAGAHAGSPVLLPRVDDHVAAIHARELAQLYEQQAALA
jgi:hypothetical protein